MTEQKTKTEQQTKTPKLLKGKALAKKGGFFLGAIQYKDRGYVEYFHCPGFIMNNPELDQVAVRVTRDHQEIVGCRFDQRFIESLN